MLYWTEIVARYSTEKKSEIFGFAECEIIHFVNCEILLLRRNVKWNLPTFASANISHLRSKYFTAKLFHLPKGQISLKKAQRDCVRLFSWQGREDSNPRPTVLETGTLPTELHPCALDYYITFFSILQVFFWKKLHFLLFLFDFLLISIIFCL